MKTDSLTKRMIAAVLVLELLCAVAFSCTALWHERRTRLRAFDVMLEGRSDSLLGAVQDAEDPEDNVTIDPTELKLPREDVYAVYNQGGRLLGTSAEAASMLIERTGDGIHDARSGGHDYRVLQREGLRIIDRAENDGIGLRRPVTIVYAATTRHLWHEIFEAASFYLVATLLLVCLTTFLLVLLIRQLLQPIQRLAEAAGEVNAGSVAFTPPPETLKTRELRPLAEALSAAVGRLRHAFDMEHRFVGDAAHELKTAVAVVRSSIQVLSVRPRTPEEYRSGLDQILTDNERVEELVSRMLTLARFEEFREAVTDPTDIAEKVDQALRYLSSYAEMRDVRLETSLTRGLMARISAEAAQTLVSNLVVNAVQHSPAGGVVSVVLAPVPQPEGVALLQVKDSGTGIAAESLPHVFERFYREDSSRSRETGGAGLGLSICKSIVESAGGTIEVDSVQGHGTRVTASFRLA